MALYGKPGIHIFKILVVLPYLIKTAYYTHIGVKGVIKNPDTPKNTADKEFFHKLKIYAKSLGVTSIGFTEVPKEYIFRTRAILFKNVIVLLMNMDKSRIKKAPSVWTGLEVWRTYAALSKASYRIAEFLRKYGYAAQPDPPVGGSVHFPLLAQKAGMGYIGKHSLLISYENGPSQRIAVVYTNIENLPYTDERRSFYSWISEFCNVCKSFNEYRKSHLKEK